MKNRKRFQTGVGGHRSGFTIVELLIVIVVIAILAVISVVAFNGVNQRAVESAMKSELATAVRKLEASKVESSAEDYPSSLTAAGIRFGSAETSAYFVNNNDTPSSFCIETVKGMQAFYVTQSSTEPLAGSCPDNFSLLGHWTFNGNSNDSSGSSWPVSVEGTPALTTGQSGAANGAYQFSGDDDWFFVPTFTTNGEALSAMTATAWVYPAANPGSHDGYFGFRGDDFFYVLQLAGSNNLECRVSPTTAAGYVDAPAPGPITPNAWNFIALVYTGSEAQCYVDGVGGAAASITGTFTISSDDFYIGSAAHTISNGRIDDVRLYSRALSAATISALYAAGAQ